MSEFSAPTRDPAPLLERALHEWGGQCDLWVFGYASLIWRPEFDFAERRDARVHGWHRALKETMHILDVMPAYERAPLDRLKPEDRDALRQLVHSIGFQHELVPS